MGALAVNNFLGLNPVIASKLAGVMYSAPLFGHYKKQNVIQRLFVSLLALLRDDLMLLGGIPIHRISRNKQYIRQMMD